MQKLLGKSSVRLRDGADVSLPTTDRDEGGTGDIQNEVDIPDQLLHIYQGKDRSELGKTERREDLYARISETVFGSTKDSTEEAEETDPDEEDQDSLPDPEDVIPIELTLSDPRAFLRELYEKSLHRRVYFRTVKEISGGSVRVEVSAAEGNARLLMSIELTTAPLENLKRAYLLQRKNKSSALTLAIDGKITEEGEIEGVNVGVGKEAATKLTRKRAVLLMTLRDRLAALLKMEDSVEMLNLLREAHTEGDAVFLELIRASLAEVDELPIVPLARSKDHRDQLSLVALRSAEATDEDERDGSVNLSWSSTNQPLFYTLDDGKRCYVRSANEWARMMVLLPVVLQPTT